MKHRFPPLLHVTRSPDGDLHLLQDERAHITYAEWIRTLALCATYAAKDLGVEPNLMLEAAARDTNLVKLV